MLAAALDPRVSACFCCDPVDNTVWAPVGPGFPSALQALRDLGRGGVGATRHVHCLPHPPVQHASACPGLTAPQEGANQRVVPLAVVGSALGGDCAPRAANFRRAA